MRKHLIRRLGPVIAVAFLLMGFTNVVHAGVPSRLKLGWMVLEPQTLKYLSGGQSSIEPAGTGAVEMSGRTLANQVVEWIGITFYLQVYDDATGTWEDAGSWPYSKTSASSIESNVIVPVESGKTYRVRALHEVWNAGVHESGWSVTPGTFVP